MLLALFTACGDGGSSNNNGGGNNNQSSVSVSITPASVTAYFGESKSIPVTTQNTDFTISVSPASGSGCIKSGNNIVCTPTASGTYSVKATATADTTKSVTATVRVPELEILGGGNDELTFYADDTEEEKITFNAAGDWTASVTDGSGNVPSWVALSVESNPASNGLIDETFHLYAAGNDGTVSGAAGNNTIVIALQLNNSGSDRAATIKIMANGQVIEITITQKSVTEDGTSLCQTCTVTFDSNGGGGVSPMTRQSGARITLPTARRGDYTFYGWYPTQSFNPDERLAAGDSYTVTANVTLYAKWIRFTTIDHPDATSNTLLVDINNNGQIVGEVDSSWPSKRAFLYDGDKFVNIDYPGSASTFSASGINDSGQIVGAFRDSDGVHGFLKDGDNYAVIDPPDAQKKDTVWRASYGINNSCQVVWNLAGDSYSNSFLKDGNNYTTIVHPDAGESQRVAAVGINDSGQIVGNFMDSDLRGHGFLKDGDSYTTIDYPDANVSGIALYGINNLGQIVGAYVVGGNTEGARSFLLDKGRFIEIAHPDATSTYAYGINDSGQIVGYFNDSKGVSHGFLLEGLITAP